MKRNLVILVLQRDVGISVFMLCTLFSMVWETQRERDKKPKAAERDNKTA